MYAFRNMYANVLSIYFSIYIKLRNIYVLNVEFVFISLKCSVGRGKHISWFGKNAKAVK